MQITDERLNPRLKQQTSHDILSRISDNVCGEDNYLIKNDVNTYSRKTQKGRLLLNSLQ